MRRLAAAVTTLAMVTFGWVGLTATPAFAALCDGDPLVTYSKTTTFPQGHAYWSTIRYRVCWNTNQQRLVDQGKSWTAGYDYAGSSASCAGFGVLNGIDANWSFTDTDGHSFNPAAFNVPCQTDGRHSVTRSLANYSWGGRLHPDSGASWRDHITVKINNLPDDSVTHSGGFPLAP